MSEWGGVASRREEERELLYLTNHEVSGFAAPAHKSIYHALQCNSIRILENTCFEGEIVANRDFFTLK